MGQKEIEKRMEWNGRLWEWLEPKIDKFIVYGMTFTQAALDAKDCLELPYGARHVAKTIRAITKVARPDWLGGRNRWACMPLLRFQELNDDEWNRLKLKCAHLRGRKPMTPELATRTLMIEFKYRWPVVQVAAMLRLMKIETIQPEEAAA